MPFSIKRRWNWNVARLRPEFQGIAKDLRLLLPFWEGSGNAFNAVDGTAFPIQTGTTWGNGPMGSVPLRTAATLDHFLSGVYQPIVANSDYTIWGISNPAASATNIGSLIDIIKGGPIKQFGILFNSSTGGAPSSGSLVHYYQSDLGVTSTAIAGAVDGNHHAFTARRLGGALSIWVDRQKGASEPTANGDAGDAAQQCSIGGLLNTPDYGYVGEATILAAWQRALSDAEIVALSSNWLGLVEERPSYVSLWTAATSGGGTPPPPTSGRQYFYAESTALSSTTSATFADKTMLTFTPDASSSYWLLWSAVAGGSTTNSDSNYRLQHDTASSTLCDQNIESADNTDVYHVAGLATYAAPGSPTSQTFSIEYSSEGGQTAEISDARIVAIKADAADAWQEAASAAARSTNTFAAASTLNFTPASTGDYLIIAYAESTASSTTVGTFIRLFDGTTAYGAAEPLNAKDAANFVPWMTMVRATSLSGSQSWSIQYRGNGTATTTLRNLRILALRLSAFPANFYGETRAEQTTTGTTDVDAASVTATTAAYPHLVISTALIRNSSTSVSTRASFKKDGSVVGTSVIREANIASARNFFGLMYVETPTAASHTYKCSFNSETSGNTAGMLESAVALLQLEAPSTGPQDLTGSFLSSTAVLYAATVTRGAVSLTAPFLASTAALNAATVAPGAATVSPPLVASTAALTQPTVTTGAVGLSPSAIASTEVVRQPTVTRGAVTITSSTLASTAALTQPTLTTGAVGISTPFLSPASILLSPTVAPGTVALSPPAIGSAAVLNLPALAYGMSPPIIVNVAALRQASVVPGAVTASPPAIGSTATLAQPSLTTGPVTVTTATLASAAAAYTPTAAVGPVSLSPPHLAATTALYTPALGLNVLAEAITSALTLHAPSVARGAVTLQLPAIDSTAFLHEPSLAVGPVSLLAAFLASELALFMPSVGVGVSSLELATIMGGVYDPDVYEPGIYGSDVYAATLSLTLNLPVMATTAAVYASSLAYGLALPALTPTATLHEPALAMALALASIGSEAGLHPPALTPGPVLAALPAIESAETVHGASLTSDGALALVQIPSMAALYEPSLRLNLSVAHHSSTLALHDPALALNLTSPHIGSTEALHGASVAIGAVALQPPHLDSAAALYAAALDAGGVVLVPPFIGSQAAAFAPTLALSLATAHRPSEEALHLPSLALNLSAAGIGPTFEAFPPVIPPPAGGLATATVESVTALYEPVATAVSALVVSYLDGTLATYAPSVARGPVTILLPHLDATVILRPPMVFQGASGIAHRISVTLAFGAHGLARLEQASRGALQLPSTRRQRVQLRWTNNGN